MNCLNRALLLVEASVVAGNAFLGAADPFASGQVTEAIDTTGGVQAISLAECTTSGSADPARQRVTQVFPRDATLTGVTGQFVLGVRASAAGLTLLNTVALDAAVSLDFD
ncbi:hypothetical protein HT102_04570 [Hoyosella sp. G463]|uniref:Uncharacterized protein n=1 Tax=Lolliginicoccus lacisalsi TaxID=2742202 RepID=A0A927JBS1_9ACTN|nr:hypothetical protein [Lolliginicoccus lacisalsi]MBD8505757.1 hypothetical protein [Lolliginicoccus lacisalsi]